MITTIALLLAYASVGIVIIFSLPTKPYNKYQDIDIPDIDISDIDISNIDISDDDIDFFNNL